MTCLHKVVDDFCEMIDDGDMCGICFLDIEKCFDTIHHGILLSPPRIRLGTNSLFTLCE